MRDIVRHTMYQVPGSSAQLLEKASDPRRTEYLARFADQEGQVFLRRFWHKYRGKKAAEIQDIFLDGLRPNATRLAAVFRFLSPQATPAELETFLRQRLEGARLSSDEVARLYERTGPAAYDLPDRGYVARVHPLELWLVGYLSAHPESSWSELVQASAKERQAVYRWLFNTRFKGAQDSRIYTMLEVEAFLDIHRRWARVGYPFGHLVPSLATALGSSGDRPAALAELMGIIANNGIRQPTRRIDRLDFAVGTPYESRFASNGETGERVMAPEVAAALRNGLSEVVEGGTARRLSGAFKLADGTPLAVGGKTGTGDNRIVLGRGAARGVAMNRTATFVFYLGPRHFGTLTAYVMGPDAAKYRFTSALPVQILKSMGPILTPELDARNDNTCPGGWPGGQNSAGRPPEKVADQAKAAATDDAPPAPVPAAGDDKSADKEASPNKPAESPEAKPAETKPEKPLDKSSEKAAEKAAENAVSASGEKSPAPPPPATPPRGTPATPPAPAAAPTTPSPSAPKDEAQPLDKAPEQKPRSERGTG